MRAVPRSTGCCTIAFDACHSEIWSCCVNGLIVSLGIFSSIVRSSSMDERAPMTLGQAIAGIILAVIALSWAVDRFGLVIQLGGGR